MIDTILHSDALILQHFRALRKNQDIMGLLQIVWVEIGPNIRETSSGRGFQRIFPMKDTICAAVTMVSVVLKTV